MSLQDQMDRAQENYDAMTDPKYELPDEEAEDLDQEPDYGEKEGIGYTARVRGFSESTIRHMSPTTVRIRIL